VTPMRPVVKPGAVTSLKATSRKGAIRVTWGPPTDLGGATAVTYQYRVGKQAWKPTTGTSVTDNGKKGTTVTVSVRAVNEAGAGPASTVSATPR